MVSDIDIWRSATLLIQQHGTDAPSVAARRCNECLLRGDIVSQQIWMRVLRAIKKLQQDERPPDEPLH